METPLSQPAKPDRKSRLGLIVTLIAIAFVISLFLFGRYTDFLNVEALEAAIGSFADGPWGVPALILTFCACAFIGVPQFILIGIAVYAFGPAWGALYAWVATLCSGSLTFWIGRLFGQTTVQRLGEGRIKRLTQFVSRNAFAASAIVRNAPAGPFLMVNMLFGAVRAGFLAYLAGMALGIIPKIALVAFGLQAIQAALSGNIWLAIGTGFIALATLIGGMVFARRYKRRKGENIAPDP